MHDVAGGEVDDLQAAPAVGVALFQLVVERADDIAVPVTSLLGYRDTLPDSYIIDLKIGCSFAALNGTERILAPVASKIAFEIAEGTTAAVGSPAPHSTIAY